MKKRGRRLPEGWYPESAEEIRQLREGWRLPAIEGGALAAIAPHAGWYFSGRLAALAWSCLRRAQTIVVIGGHLGPQAPVLYAPEDLVATPFGELVLDEKLRGRLLEELGREGIRAEEDRDPDNTVEVQLPFFGLFAPGARLLWLRAPAGRAALVLGAALWRAAEASASSVALLASTDLTHYGPDYGFEPRGRGQAALDWVRSRNDAAFLEALVALDPEAVLERADSDRSACSSGAVAAALAFCGEAGAGRALVHAYATSHDRRPAASFVGYAAAGIYA